MNLMAKRKTNTAGLSVDLTRLVQLSVSLTPAEEEVFFRMLAMSTGEETDVDYKELVSIEQKFNAASKPNGIKSKETVETIVARMQHLTDDERIDVMSEFCRSCGGTNPRCHCWNDE